jgi:DNA modification methylase
VISLLMGDCRVTLPTLAAKSVQCVITSPPYYGLRDYGLPPLVWGGDAEHEHHWSTTTRRVEIGAGNWTQAENGPGLRSGIPQTRFKGDVVAARANTEYAEVRTGFCPCGAWLGSLGLEPTPELWIEHLVEVFREVRRVLRDDGVCFINLGDSYAGSGKGPSKSLQGEASCIGAPERGLLANRRASGARGSAGPVLGYKPKDLMMLPARLALALQADGWYLRSMIPWLKRNSMPESCDDRPATAVEYIYLLSKSNETAFWTHRDHEGSRTRPAPDYRWVHKQTGEEVGTDPGDSEQWRRINLWSGHDYFWDADAVRVAASLTTHSRGTGDGGPKMRDKAATLGMHEGWGDATRTVLSNRNRRNSDWFFETWQGLLLDEQDEPLALVVNPAPFKESHFATFPPKLVEPMVKASTSERGQCPECGAPWARVTERATYNHRDHGSVDRFVDLNNGRAGDSRSTTIGWRPTCKHNADLVPQVILDPFAGAGTVGVVADRLGRNAILCELKPDYSQMGAVRVTNDAPMFVQMELR